MLRCVVFLVCAGVGCKQDAGSSDDEAPASIDPAAQPAGLTADALAGSQDGFRHPFTVAQVRALGFAAASKDLREVGNTEELLAAIDDHVTIVLKPGEYRFGGTSSVDGRALSTKLLGAVGVELVGLGSPPPRLLQGDFTLPGLRLERVSGVRLYNLEIGHDTTCHAPALEVTESRDVSAVNVDLYGTGSEGLAAIGSSRLELGHCRIHDCSHALASVDDSSDIVIHDCIIEDNGNSNLIGGFYVSASDLLLRDVVIRRNVLGPRNHAELFALDTETHIAMFGPSRGPSRLRLERVTIADNAFSSLTNEPERLEQTETSVAPGQFRNEAPPKDARWWCECHRLNETNLPIVTRCWPSHDACRTSEAGLSKSEAPPGLVAGGVVHRCRHVADPNTLRSDWTTSDETLTAGGGCSIPTPSPPGRVHPFPNPAETAGSLPASPAVPWKRVEPVLFGEMVGGRFRVWLDVRDRAAFEALQAGSAGRIVQLDAGAAELPEELRVLPPPVVITPAGPEPLGAFSFVLLSDRPEGLAWVAEYDRKVDQPFVVVRGAPHPEARLHPASSPEAVELAHWAVPLARRLFADDPVVLPLRREIRWRASVVGGRFPGEAVRMVAVHHGDLGASSGVVFTVDATGEIVQLVWEGAELELEAQVDLDGDGYDEVIAKQPRAGRQTKSLLRLTPSAIDVIVFADFTL